MMYAHALLLLLFSGFVHALPLISRDVISPPITSPTAGVVWTVGQTIMVTWNTTVIPPASQVTNPIGKIVLGHQANNSLNLDLDHPLASNFQLTDGQVNITVPDVEPRDDYIIVLFGDSGNTSPEFTIQRSASSSSGAPASSSSASSLTLTSLISTPIPITGTEITGGTSSNTPSSVRPSVISAVSTSISTITAVPSATSSPSPLSTSLALSSSIRTISEPGTSESSAASTTQAVTQSDNAGINLGHSSRAYYFAVASLIIILNV